MRSQPALDDAVVRRLNRGVRRADAKLVLADAGAYGPALRFRCFRLGNGLRVFIVVDETAPVASFMTWYHVGSRDEVPGKTGLAHLFEHLMFSGTKTRPPGVFDRAMEEAGAEANAATWVDWTYYYENVPPRYLPLAMQLEGDRMANLVLDDQVVANEKDVVANERRFRVDDDVEGATNELLYGRAFTKHPYRYPTIGTMKDILGLTTEDCRAFYRTYYAPNNATLVVVGHVDEEDVLGSIQATYGGLPASQLPRRRAVVEPTPRRERRVKLPQPTASDKIAVGYHAPPLGHPDHAVLTVLNEVLFGGRSSRIHQTLVHDRELCTEAHGSIAPFHDPGLYEMWLSMRPGKKGEQGLAALDKELSRLLASGVAEAELDKAKNRLELAFLQALETAGGKAEQLGFYATVVGDVRGVFAQLDLYRAVHADALRRVASDVLRSSRRTIVHVVPRRGDA